VVPPFLAEGGGPRFGIRRGSWEDNWGVDGTGNSGMVPADDPVEPVVGLLELLENLSENRSSLGSDIGPPSQYSGWCCSVYCRRWDGSSIDGAKLGRGGLGGGGPFPSERSPTGLFGLLPGPFGSEVLPGKGRCCRKPPEVF